MLTTNVADPSEREARQLRVIQSEPDGSVEATAATLLRNDSVGLSYATSELPPPPVNLSTEKIMEDLRAVTLQYLSCADPVERAARQRRVIQSELDGTVDATAARILQSSTLATIALSQGTGIRDPTPPLQEPTPQPSPDPTANTSRKRGRPAKTKQTASTASTSSAKAQKAKSASLKPTSSRNNIMLSPRAFAGMGSKKRMMTRVQASKQPSPGNSSRQSSRQQPTLPTAPPTGALPLGENLAKRGLMSNIACCHCGEVETKEHIFLHCSFTRQIWSDYLWKQTFSPSDCDAFATAFMASVRVTNLPPLGVVDVLFPWICWGIWKARNFKIFENRSFTPAEILAKAIVNAREWHQAQLPNPRTVSSRTIPPLLPPAMTTGIVCYTDAAWIASTNRAGCGWHFPDLQRQTPLQGTKAFDSVSSPLVAEGLAVRSALFHALEAGISEICIKTDCQALVTALSSKCPPADLYGISRDVEFLSSWFSCISFTFIPRSQNYVADSLAKSVLNSTPIN
ncbi:hypothetical protein Bca4012_064865 [Brassica carinata]